MGRKKTGKILNCFFCGKAKYYPISRIRYSRVFCDESCHGYFVKDNGLQKREKNHAWSGGKFKDNRGYIRLRAPEHPLALSSGYIREHRFVAMQKIGRLLKKNEDVHHIDGNKLNNNPKNLEVIEHGKHSSMHNRGRKR